MNELQSKPLGVAALDRRLIHNLESLWDGPLRPEFLESIEQAVRAFLVSPVITISQIPGSPWDTVEMKADGSPAFDYEDYFTPLGGTLLQYEFTMPDSNHNIPFQPLSSEESTFLKQEILSEIRNKAFEILPKWIGTKGQAFEYIDAWYSGAPLFECERRTRFRFRETWLGPDDDLPFKGIESLGNHAIFHLGPSDDANYLVGCHRAGLIVYGNTPMISLCKNHLFSKWPAYLFKNLDEKFRESIRLVAGPGVGVTLPPLTLLLLSRAPSRSLIPETLSEMRDEYEQSRDQLWSLLGEMWTAPSFKEQLKILNTISDAAESIFDFAFTERFDAMSLGISATDLLTGNVSSTLSNLREQRRCHARVASMSFAAKLSKDIRKGLLNNRDVLNRHLTDSELCEFATNRI